MLLKTLFSVLVLVDSCLKLFHFGTCDLINHGPTFDEDKCWQAIDVEMLCCLLIDSYVNTQKHNILFLLDKLFNLWSHDPARWTPFGIKVYDYKFVSCLKDGHL